MQASSGIRHVIGSPRWADIVDMALAAGLGAIGQAAVWSGAADEGPIRVTAVTYAVMSLALVLRRRQPLVMAALVSAAWLTQALLAAAPTSIWALVLILVVAFSVGANAETRPATVGLVMLLAATYAGAWLTVGAPLGDRLFTAPVLGGGPWLAGRLVRRYVAQARTLDALNAELEQRRIEDVQAATTEERARIARELHDVVAHGISVMVIQAAAAAGVLDHDPARARDPLDQIRQTGKAALVDMRRLLGVLRADDGLSRSPQPGLTDLPDLVASMRSAGLDVRLDMPDPPPSLASGCDLAAYRIVQEALTNALKHGGPVAASVRVGLVGERLDLEICNDRGAHRPRRATQPGGHGLIGMHERAALFGGSVDAGPHARGWRVVAHLPLDPADHR